jgi:ubiquitin-protein ligase E3 D
MNRWVCPAPIRAAAESLAVQRQAFVEHLAGHSDSGRLHDQDAVLSNRIKGPEALLTLPEFIRETVPPEAVKADPHTVLTLPEFIKEPVPSETDLKTATKESLKGLRNRSLSAPTLGWILPSGMRTPPDRKAHKRRSKSPPQSNSAVGMRPRILFSYIIS